MKKPVLLLFLTLLCFALDAKPRRRKRGFRRPGITVHRAAQRTSQKWSLLKQKSDINQSQHEQDSHPQVNSQTKINRLLFLKQSLDKLAQQTCKRTTLGIKVASLKDLGTVYEKNSDQTFIPASNTKVFTASAAYHLLDPEAPFETNLYTDQQLSSGRIQNLFIKGSGDPTLITKDLEKLVHGLKDRFIREIKGNIVIDASIFDFQSEGPGWSKGDGPIFDKSPVAGLMVNHSCITVRVKPATMVGRRPTVFIDPVSSHMQIENRAKTVAHAGKHSLHVSRRADNTIIVTGTIAKRSKQKYYVIALDRPHVYAGYILEMLLKKHKIVCKGKIMIGAVPLGAKLLAKHTSEPVKQIIRYMMKTSDNLYSDALFKKMGAQAFGAPGTWTKGKKALEDFLVKQAKMPVHNLVLNDGSGLSRANKISPNHLATCLTWMYKESPHKELFIDSLPISGVDGTLRRRMKNRIVHAQVKAKTGSLFGVSSLAGYINSKNGDPLIFVIMINRNNRSAVEYKRKLEDQICTLLAAHAFSTF